MECVHWAWIRLTFDDEDEDDLDPDLKYHRIISARLATRKEKKLYEDRKAIMYGV